MGADEAACLLSTLAPTELEKGRPTGPKGTAERPWGVPLNKVLLIYGFLAPR